MATVDVIMVSDAKNKSAFDMTQGAIDSIREPNMNIVIVESNINVSYRKVKVIYPDSPFNYNGYLNMGARLGSGEYIFFGNNDLFFEENWGKAMLEELSANEILSGSPLCPKTGAKYGILRDTGNYLGYELMSIFCGWAFVMKRSLYSDLGGLNEQFKFWCSDDIVIQQLKERNIKHALVTRSIVHHLNGGSNTLKLIEDISVMFDYTINQVNNYAEIIDDEIWEKPHLKELYERFIDNEGAN
ncbi:MAG: hypothetical protein QM763_08505 [Agriterribacter sp.]